MAKTPATNDETPTPSDGAARPAAPPSATQRSAAPEPTEQLPMESAPVSATSAASGGATGLDGETARQTSVFRRHPLAAGLAASVIAVVLVSGLTALGVGAAVTASLTSSTTREMPMGNPTAAPPVGGIGGAATAGRLAFRATIQSIDSNSWTILTKKGKTVTVTIDSTTQFGTKEAAETAGSFAVGDNVIIVATRGPDGAPTATRVVDASALGTGAGSATTPMPSMTSTPTT